MDDVLNTRDFQALHALLRGIAEEKIGRHLPLPTVVENLLSPIGEQSETIPDDALAWIELLDHCAVPALVRTAVQELHPEDSAVAVFVSYLCAKTRHSDADRERVDWLSTYLFRNRQARGEMIGKIDKQLTDLMPELPAAPLSGAAEQLLYDLAELLGEMSGFTTFQKMNSSGIIARGREVKKELKDEFFLPEALGAVVNYNLIFGKKFDVLFVSATSQMRKFGALLANKDYHYVASDFAKLFSDPLAAAALAAPAPMVAAEPDSASAALVGAPPVGAAPVGAPPAAAPLAGAPAPISSFDGHANLVEQQMREIGLDPSREMQKLKTVMGRATQFLRKANGPVLTIPLMNCECHVYEWEARALVSDFAEHDTSFRAEFSRQIRHAVAIRCGVAEEWLVYQRKRDTTDYLWKPHYDSLVWLLYEGRLTFDALETFAATTRQKGLPERAEQLQKTAARLDESIGQLSKLF